MKELAIIAAHSNLYSAVTGNVFVAQSPEAFTYDDDGNLLSDGRWQYTWNGENRLIKAIELIAPTTRQPYIVEYAYDHQGRMVWKQITAPDTPTKTITYTWDDYNIIAENITEASVTKTTYNTWGLDLSGTLQGAGGVGGLLAVMQGRDGSPSRPFLPCYDANGNVTEYINSDGTIAAHQEYDPFGDTVVAAGDTTSFTHWFSTKLWCTVTELSEYEYRKYNPNLGRWLSRDPAEERAGRAIYVWNANAGPIRIDGFGLACQRTHGEGINLRTEAALYKVFGGLVSVGVSGTLYDCCCDNDIIPLDAYEVTIEGKASVGFGLGSHIILPILGRVGYTIQGPQFSWSQSVSLVKECGETNPSIVVTLADVSGNVGGAVSFGSAWGVSAGYWSNYGIVINLKIADRTASIIGTVGWQGGGEWEVNTPVVNLHGELMPFDYTWELLNDVYIKW